MFNYIQIVPYLVMRVNFINPVQTPIMTENFLRMDFRFDMYLAYCYGKTLTKFFQISIFTILLLTVTVVSILLMSQSIADDYNSFITAFGAIATIFGLLVILMHSSIEKTMNKLTPSMYDDAGNLQNWSITSILTFNDHYDNDKFETSN